MQDKNKIVESYIKRQLEIEHELLEIWYHEDDSESVKFIIITNATIPTDISEGIFALYNYDHEDKIHYATSVILPDEMEEVLNGTRSLPEGWKLKNLKKVYQVNEKYYKLNNLIKTEKDISIKEDVLRRGFSILKELDEILFIDITDINKFPESLKIQFQPLISRLKYYFGDY